MKIKNIKKQIAGFSLIEMILVMIVLSSLIYLGVRYMDQKNKEERIDQTAADIHQILTASLAYYIEQNTWPIGTTTWSSTSILQTAGYLMGGSTLYANPWSPVLDTATYPSVYSLGADSQKKRLDVITYIGTGTSAAANARAIAGKIPLAQVCKTYTPGSTSTCAPCTAATDPCYVVASIGIPTQVLNKALTVNYAGIFHSGACVKAPTCPIPNMEPMITVVPSAVAGITEAPSGTNCNSNNIKNCNTTTYPLTGYTAFATPLAGPYTQGAAVQPRACNATSGVQTCTLDGSTNITATAGDRYWRVCLGIDTSSGKVSPGANNPWGQLSGTIMVFTRCAPLNETTATKNSGFDVYQ